MPSASASAIAARARYDLGVWDDLARHNTWLHRLDPRAKVLTTLFFLVTVVSFPKYALTDLIPFFLYPLFLLFQGHIPFRVVARQVAYVAPFALLLGLFNPWLDAAPIAHIGSLPIARGWVSWGSILLRVLLTAGTALILVGITGFPNLAAALDRLGCPRVFVTQLLFLYRYLFVLVEEAGHMARAREARSAGRRTSGLSTYGPLLGHLFLRTYDRARRIHRAMLARGFTGALPLGRPLTWRGRDSLFCIIWMLYFVGFRHLDLARKLGEKLLGFVS